MSGPLGTSGGGAAGVTSVTAGNGITVSGTTTPTVSASLAAGTGIGISGTTTLSVSNTGVTSLAGTGISVSASTGAVTITAPVVAGGTGISVSGSQTTSLSITNSGVTSIVAGTNVSVSGATGAVTVNAPAFGTTITASTIGGTAAAGTSTGVTREDHKHAFPAGAAPSALTVSSTQATGTSASPALADHVHAMPGSATAGASAVGDTAATGTATTVALSDHRHSREAFGTPVVVNGQTTSLATGSLTTLARADHVHTMSNVLTLLASTTLGSAAASYTFTSIPQNYSHLMLISRARSSYVGVNDYIALTYNADVIWSNSLYVNDNTTGSNADGGAVHGTTNWAATRNAVTITFILLYSGSDWKISTKQTGYSTSASVPSTFGGVGAPTWYMSTTAISAIKLQTTTGSNLQTGSSFQLYGLP